MGPLIAVAVLLISGCGQSQPSARRQLAAYLGRVNRVERQLAPPLTAVTRASGRFARSRRSGGGTAAAGVARHSEQALLTADRQITHLRARLAAIPPPASARRLRATLLTLVDAQLRLAQSTAKLIVFLPGFGRAMAPLSPAITRLERVLSVNQAVQAVYAQKESALLAFTRTLDQIAVSLQALDPPRMLAPSYRAQLTAVRGMATAAQRLAAALAHGASGQVPAQLAAFDRAAAAPRKLSAQKAQVASIKAYNRQVGRLARLDGQAQRMRLRLANRLR